MVSFALMHPWVIPVAILVVIAAGVAGWFARRPAPPPRKVTWVANASYVSELPAFRSRLSLYRIGVGCLALLLVGAAAVSGVLTSRPVDKQVRSEELASRDIVLCLDVSGSMVPFDSEIVDRFLELLPSFQGERVALSIWNSTSRTVFPLTDDYAMVEEELKEAAYVLSFDLDSIGWTMDQEKFDRLMTFIGGTQSETATSASLVGDGLASCALMFDEEETDRARSIIFATDNDVQGSPIYTLSEAADVVAERDIGLFGMYAGETTDLSEAQEKEYRQVVESQGGLFFQASDPDLADDVIDEINQQQAVDLDADPKVVVTDRPEGIFPWLVAVLAIYLVVVWRLRT